MTKECHSNHNQSGQVLLIIVMLLTTAGTILLSLSFNAQTQTKTSKLEEDQKRAFAAAESVLEASIQKSAGTYTLGSADLNLQNLSAFSGQATVSETTGPSFITPLVQKDQAYTFYLTSYPSLPNSTFTDNINIYFMSDNQTCPPTGDGSALEITYINNDNTTITKALVDPCDLLAPNNIGALSTNSATQLNNTQFSYKVTSISTAGKKLIIVRVLFTATKIGFEDNPGNNLPSQGKLTTAQAQTSDTHVASSIYLFQSYPQIPADFYVTRF